MRPIARAFPLLAAALLAAPHAAAQQPDSAGASSGLVRIDPCTGKPYRNGGAAATAGTPSTGPTPSAVSASGAAPGAPAGGPAAGTTPATSSGTPSAISSTGATSATSSTGATPGTAQQAPGSAFLCARATAADPAAAARTRESLRLGRGAARGQVRLGPAASVSVPTGFGVDAGEVFLGAAYQGRTRYTEEDDAAAVAGLGLGTRRLVALEVALTTYSTFRGAPLETGGLSFKLHRALPRGTSVAVGWENAVLWGGSDDRGSLYAVATRVTPLREDPAERFSMAVFTLGVGNGRFRFEEDDADDRQTLNVFAAAGLRVSDPLSVVADWTGQDLNVAASVTPIRRVPLVLTGGLADLTGSAGDGARLILSVGYGLSIRQPF